MSVASKREGTTTGDLIVTVEVDVPSQLTDEQRAAVEQLAAATTVNPRVLR
jgi:molecular chaperone DnaJ